MRRITNLLDPKDSSKIAFFSGKYKILFKNNLDEKYKKSIQNIIDKDYETFLKLIAKGRKMSFEQAKKASGESLIYLAPTAKELGLIDEIMLNNSRPEIIEKFFKKWNLKRAKVVEFKANKSDGLIKFNELFEEFIAVIEKLNLKK